LNALQAMLNKAYKQNWNEQYPDEVSKAQAAISKALESDDLPIMRWSCLLESPWSRSDAYRMRVMWRGK
jgi:hypothetical protein